MLRDTRFLAYLGEYGRIQSGVGSEPAGVSWGLWYLRATARELGLPSATFDGAYQDQLLRAVETHVIVDQLNYHCPNALALDKMDRWLRNYAQFSFYVVVSVIGLFIVMLLVKSFVVFPENQWGMVLENLAPWKTFLAVFLPAASAALASIKETGDFETFARRSEQTARALEQLRLNSIPIARQTASLDETANVLFTTAQILTEDLSTWQVLYGRKRLDLRA